MVNSGPLVVNLFVGLYSHFVVNPPQTVLMGFSSESSPVSSETVCGTTEYLKDKIPGRRYSPRLRRITTNKVFRMYVRSIF